MLLSLSFAVSSVGAAIGAIGIGVLGISDWKLMFSAAVVLAIGISVPSCTLWMYTAELFPTRMRGFATALCSSASRLSAIVSPLLLAWMLGGLWGAGGVFTSFLLATMAAAVVVSVFGVETRNKSLEELSP